MIWLIFTGISSVIMIGYFGARAYTFSITHEGLNAEHALMCGIGLCIVLGKLGRINLSMFHFY